VVQPKPVLQPPPPVVQSKPAPQTRTPVQSKVEQAKVVPIPQKQQALQPQPVHFSPYPFSIYLGAFMTLDRAKTAVSIYKRESGISAFWVKVDLREKGIWYRVFTGYFHSAEEAEAFISQKQLKESEVKQTKYSTLIGEYSRMGEAEDVVRRLSQLGYSSYFVTVPGGPFKLYSGAFYTMEGAQKQYAELASKGIKSRAVER
jgi:cell division septation protein DedD